MTDTRPDERDGPVRGCLSVLALYGIGAVIVGVVWAAWPAGTGSPPPEPVPATSSPSWSRTPVTFPPEVDEVLERAWNTGRHGCGITGPAVDDLAAALVRDLEGTPASDARWVAGQWVTEHCRG